MKTITSKFDFCIVGGGMAGLCAAIAGARHGLRVALIQDRPVFGGNASSEIRMWICGAHGYRETGILEEILLENFHRNGNANYSIWDSVLYEKVLIEPNLTPFLNCSCTEVVTENNRIRSVKGWQLTTETWHIIEADYFADCSGDSILAFLSGAEFRVGREASGEFNESIQPAEADQKTMGMSCLFQIRETDRPQIFVPPSWAEKYETDEDLPNRPHDTWTNFWWIELGGEDDTLHDAEMLRDQLLKIVFGVWDHMKNHGDHGVENWVIDWIGFLPGKRESRRCIGDHILTQNDVLAEGRFEDVVGYGGWSMDDHFPAGFRYSGQPTIFHKAPSPYGIPLRCLYSKNIENLFFAGRNISASHAALSSTRVMGTCAILGQAVGTAAALAARYKFSPREVYQHKIHELQQMLMKDDCWLPWQSRTPSELTTTAIISASSGNPAPLRNGVDRPFEGKDNCWIGKIGDWLEYSFEQPKHISSMRLVFDSNLQRSGHNMPCKYTLELKGFHTPQTIVKKFRIDLLNELQEWVTIIRIDSNHQRFVNLNIESKTKSIRFVPLETWGDESVQMFAWDIS